MGECVNLPLKLRTSSKDLLTDALKANPHIMFLFDEVDVFDTAGNLRKFDMLRKIQDVAGNPMVLCGTSILYNKLYSERNYEKFGFALAHRNIRYEGRGGAVSGLAGIVDLATLPFDTIVSYDSAIFPAPRATFLEKWVIRPDGASMGFTEDGELKGYGVMRPCRTGFKIGPLFADSPDIAERLFDALKARAPEEAPVFLDLPAINPAAVAFARKRNMTPVFETGRMYSREAPAVPMEKDFGITSFELG